MKKFLQRVFLFTIFLSGITINAQNVGINATGIAPGTGAGLDVNFTNKGVLIPRVSLTNVAAFAPVVGVATTSLLIYNTNAAVTGGTGVGYYFWNGGAWERLLSGTPLVDNGLYYNSVANRVRLGGPLVEPTTITQAGFQMTYNLNGTGDFIVQDNGVNRFEVLDNGRIEMPYTLDASGSANTGALEIANSLRLDGNEVITNTNTTMYLQNDNNGDLIVDANTLVVDASANRVGINTTVPSQALEVVGNVRFSGALMPNNQAGTANKTLLSQGAGLPPIWSGFTFLNTPAIANVGKYYSTLSWSGTWWPGNMLTFVINDPNLVCNITNSSVVFVSFDCTNSNATMQGFIINNVKVNAGNMAISVLNNTPWGFTGGFPITYVAFY